MSAIEWTDETWNPVTGCTKVSPGCAHCYAERLFPRVYGRDRVKDSPDYAHRPRRFTDVAMHHDRLDQPLRWRKPRRVFVNSMSDLFHEDVPDEFIDRVFAIMALGSAHTFQVLTKRPERMCSYLSRDSAEDAIETIMEQMDVRALPKTCRTNVRMRLSSWSGLTRWPLPNVWCGTSVEDQRRADERIPVLLDTPAAVRFLSCEPLLGPVDLRSAIHVQAREAWDYLSGWRGEYMGADDNGAAMFSGPGDPWHEGGSMGPGLDWIIVGGESGPKARPCDVRWVRKIIRQCREAAVPVFVKQLGQACHFMDRKDRKGGDPDEWPEDLRVREFPEVRA